MFKSLKAPGAMAVTLAAAGVLMVTMGIRQSMGLFLGPLNTSTGLGIATISFAMAVAQFSWGAVQPLAGAVADRWGARPVLLAGVLILAVGTALTPVMASGWGLIFTIGLLCFAVPPTPRSPLFVPLLWCLVGAQAAFLLGVQPDLGLIAAAVVGMGLLATARQRPRTLKP